MFWLILSCTEPFVGLASEPALLSKEDMIAMVGGDFLMGYPDNEPGPYGNHWKETAQPQHPVLLSDFYLDRTEVTIEQYTEFLNSLYNEHGLSMAPHHHPLQQVNWNASAFVPFENMNERPINYVSWYDASAFCAWKGKRLPTEAEFEYAIKGSDIENPRSFPWVSGGASCQKAVYYTNQTLCEKQPDDVGSRSPEGDSPEGISDLSGNVAEWVGDWSARYEDDSLIDPRGPDTGTYKLLRGGGFRETSDALRSTDRVEADPSSRSEGIGFRCAASQEEE